MFERYGQRFAFWTDEARSLLQGTLQPIFRVPRKRAITEEIPAHMQAVFDRTAEEKIQSPGAEQHLVVLRHIHHYRLTVNKSTRAFVKNIVNYAAHLLAVTGQ